MKPLLILDLDETLIHSEYHPIEFDFYFPLNKREVYVRVRPFLKEFISYAKSYFDLAIWTAASQDYARKVINEIGLPESSLIFFYHQDMCTLKYDLDSQDYYGIKNLKKISKIRPLNQVLIVDDVWKTAQNNYGNLIQIKPFYGGQDDVELLKLISYLEKIKDRANFRSIDKRGWDNNKN